MADESRVNIITPDGVLGNIPAAQLPDALEQGYAQASDKDVRMAQHQSVSGKAATLVESAVQGVGGPAGTALMASMGIPEQDILERQEANPEMQAIGTVGGLLSPVGEGALLAKAGARVAKGIETAGGGTKIAKLLAGAGRGATEGALYSAGDEASKALLDDPNQTAETALANVGMAGLLGAGIGTGLASIPGAWDNLMESKAGQYVQDFKDRITDHINGLATEDGMLAAQARKVADKLEQYKSEFQFPQSSKLEQQMDALISKVRSSGLNELSNSELNMVKQRLGDIPQIDAIKLSPGAKLADAVLSEGFEKSIGAAVGGTVGLILHHPFLGAVFGERAVTSLVKKVVPALAKKLISEPSFGAGMQSAIKLGLAAVRGEQALDRAALGVFGAAKGAFPETKVAADDKLDEHVQDYRNNPNMLWQHNRAVAAYLPEHETALAETSGRVMQYLAQLMPNTEPKLPMDPPRTSSYVERANYQDALKIANSPLSVMQKIKAGSVSHNDIAHLRTMYPALASRMQSKLTQGLIEHGTGLPYKTKLAISRFMGQPLDSSMTPAYIQSSIMQAQGPQLAPQPQQVKGRSRQNPKLEKLVSLEASQGQRAIMASQRS